MAMYRYVKAIPRRPVRRPIFLSYALMGVGGILLVWTLWPILSFQTVSAILFVKTVSPVASGTIARVPKDVQPQVAGAVVTSVPETKPADYTNANNWFPDRPQKKVVTPVNAYRLSIPKLKIDNAMVTIAGDDLNVSLVHYGGTPLPGQYGNAVVFGHSTLPQFFNPTNYKTIFSTLPTLTKGDEVYAEVDGIRYRYVVYDMIVVEPTDLTPLEQRFDDSYMTIVTCVPPGTYWKRLNVKARLERNS